MSVERQYSKAKAAANHVVWTPSEILQVPYTLDGLVHDGAAFGVLRVMGRDMLCVGIAAHFRVPAGSAATRITLTMYNGDSVPVTGGKLRLYGITNGDTLIMKPSYPLPVNSVWFLRLEIEDGPIDYLPQGITATYLLRYANGPVVNSEAVFKLEGSGIGFWQIGDTFQVT